MLTLADLVEGITGQRPAEEMVPNLELSKVVIDSREACPQSLFVALRGERRDGHDFVADAFARGAVTALVERSRRRMSDSGHERSLVRDFYPATYMPHSRGQLESFSTLGCLLAGQVFSPRYWRNWQRGQDDHQRDDLVGSEKEVSYFEELGKLQQ